MAIRRNCLCIEADNPTTVLFPSVEQYLRKMHPECDFVFDLSERALDRSHYALVDAERTQAQMIYHAFEVALRIDREKGIVVIIEEGKQKEAGT